MSRYLIAIVTATCLLAGAGFLHGKWTDRWGVAPELDIVAARYNTIPLTIGDWDGQNLEVKHTLTEAGMAGVTQRRYVNRKTGKTVSLLLVCGRPGPASIHTPDVCYAASGFKVDPMQHAGVDGLPGEFWTTDATRTQATEETRVRLFWAWNAGDGWSAPAKPRIRFAYKPVLHKLYVLRDLDSAAETREGEPCLAFLQVLLPELDRTVIKVGQ